MKGILAVLTGFGIVTIIGGIRERMALAIVIGLLAVGLGLGGPHLIK